MEFGFVVSSNPPEVQFQAFRPPGRGGGLLTVARFAGSVAALAGRLYYRDDILADLTALPSQFLAECAASDAALALGIYSRFGRDGLARLEGDFAVVVWDAGQRQLIARRDPLGGYPLFWIQRGATVAFATRLRPLVDLLPTRSVNLD